jgi:hypothetical protein
MAFTSQQMQDIIYYLGWPGKTILSGSTHYNSVIYSRLINLNADIENQALVLVERIKEIDGVLRKSIHRASTMKLQDIELNPEERLILRRERTKILGELSDLLDIDIQKSGGSGNIALIS